MNERLTPLPPTAREAMDILRPHFERADGSLTRSQVEQVLTHDSFSKADAVDILETLYLRGYIYPVDEELRITK